jgi:hypothetical protein
MDAYAFMLIRSIVIQCWHVRKATVCDKKPSDPLMFKQCGDLANDILRAVQLYCAGVTCSIQRGHWTGYMSDHYRDTVYIRGGFVNERRDLRGHEWVRFEFKHAVLDVDATYMQFTGDCNFDFTAAIIHADMNCVADNAVNDALAEQIRIRRLRLL